MVFIFLAYFRQLILNVWGIGPSLLGDLMKL